MSTVKDTQMMITVSDTTTGETVHIDKIIDIRSMEWHPENTDSTSTSLLIVKDSFDNILWEIIAIGDTLWRTTTDNPVPIHYSFSILKQELNQRRVRELYIQIDTGILYIFRLF